MAVLGILLSVKGKHHVTQRYHVGTGFGFCSAGQEQHSHCSSLVVTGYLRL